MAQSNINLVRYNGFGCYLTTAFTGPLILNDGASSTALPVYATGEALEVISSDTDDDGSPAGNGARTVQVIYLDTDGSVDSETITMNGTSAVALTDTTVARVLDLHVLTAGSSGTNEGVITIRVAGAGANRMSIPAGHGRAAPGRFTIPTGMVGVYRGFNLSNGSTGTPTRLSTFIEADFNPLTGSLNENVYQVIDWGVGGAASGVHGNFASPEKGGRRVYLPEKTTIRARAVSDVNAGCGVGGFVFVELYPKPTT